MTPQEYNAYIEEHGTVINNSEEHLFMHRASQDAIRITTEKTASITHPMNCACCCRNLQAPRLTKP